MACKGVDLTHPRWLMARGHIEQNRLSPLDKLSQNHWPIELILENDQSLWRDLEGKLALGTILGDLPDVSEDQIKSAFEQQRPVFDPRVIGNENLADLWVALAFPFRTPPIVRSHLHYLFRRNIFGNAAHGRRRSAVEAPVALAIECVAQDRLVLNSPALPLLLTGGHLSMELTAATVRLENRSPLKPEIKSPGAQPVEPTLVIEITSCVGVDPVEVVGSLKHFTKTDAHDRLFHAGNPEMARLVAEALGLDPATDVIDVGPHAVAIGAIRHGGMLEGQYWVRNSIKALEIVRGSPVAVGVLGTNLAGEWFWRRVFEPGVRLSSAPVRPDLAAGGPLPDRIALAECPDPEFADRIWLASRDWADAGLRWHDLVKNDSRADDWDLQLRIRMLNPQYIRLAHPRWDVIAGDEKQAVPIWEREPGPIPDDEP